MASPSTTVNSVAQAQALVEAALLEQAQRRRPSRVAGFVLTLADRLLSVLPYPVRTGIAKLYSLSLSRRVFSDGNSGQLTMLGLLPLALLAVLFWTGPKTPWLLWGLEVWCGLSLFALVWNTWWRLATPDEAIKLMVSLNEYPAVAPSVARWTHARGLRRGDVRFAVVACKQASATTKAIAEVLNRSAAADVEPPRLRHPSPFDVVVRAWNRFIASFLSPAAAREQVSAVLSTSTALRSELERLSLEAQTASVPDNADPRLPGRL